jgi:hypothetical protein
MRLLNHIRTQNIFGLLVTTYTDFGVDKAGFLYSFVTDFCIDVSSHVGFLICILLIVWFLL